MQNLWGFSRCRCQASAGCLGFLSANRHEQKLSSILHRAAPTAEEISLCNCKLGAGEGKAASPRMLNEALFATKDVRFKR